MIFYTIILPIGLLLLFFTFFIVKQQSAAVVERFGKFVSVRQSGLQLKIPIIAILDTNCDPNVADIPIPANDDAVRSIQLIISTLGDAIITGKQASL